MSKFFTRTGIAAVLAAAASVPAYQFLAYSPEASAQAEVRTAPTPAPPASPVTAAALPDFAGLVERYGPAVVNVSTKSNIHPTNNRHPAAPDDDDPMAPFFRNLPPGLRGMVPEQRGPSFGEGSGFIVDAGGVILTNAHVVKGADEVTVKLTDQREFKAKVLGSDAKTDVAVLKIDAQNLPTVTIGRPDALKVGEWVVAIGAPFGFENSVTQGIVSAKGRSLPEETYTPFIQTDVAVNPGNSGGPLFNLKGEVVGINSQIYSRNGGYQGISFAIPIDVAMNAQRQLLAQGHVTRGWLGVAVQGMNQQLASSFGMDQARGALVADVTPDSPAAKAGLQSGDVIVGYDGRPVLNSSDLPPLVGLTEPGRKVDVNVLREGKEKSIAVKIEPLTETASADAGDAGDESKGGLGVAVADLTPQQRQQLGIEHGGVVVTEVGEGPAAEAGIRPGDVLLRLGKEDIKSAKQLRELAPKLSGKPPMAALVQRGDSRLFLPIDVG